MMFQSVVMTMDFREVEREYQVYVNDKIIVLDKETITPSKLLEMADFSPLVYDLYLRQNKNQGEKGKTKIGKNKPLDENKQIKIQTGMYFDAILKQD